MAVLSGDLNTPGSPFVIQVKHRDGVQVPPHWHSVDENITVLSGTWVMGLGDRFSTDPYFERHFKIYLRDPGDLALAKTHLESELLAPGDKVSWLKSDICRAELNVEIEATFVKVIHE